MNKLRDDFNKILLQAFGQVEKALREYPYDEHGMVGEDFYSGKLIDKVKAHIKECERPKNPHKDVFINRIRESIAERAFGDGVEADRKALMESLE